MVTTIMVNAPEIRRKGRFSTTTYVWVLLTISVFSLYACLQKKLLDTTPGSVTTIKKSAEQRYIPSAIEKYVMDHSVELGYDRGGNETAPGCPIWENEHLSTPEIYRAFQSYARDLGEYRNKIQEFQPIPDLLESIKETGSHEICATTRLHPGGIEALFPSKQLSFSSSGFVEPLTAIMRDERVCGGEDMRKKYLLSLEYLVHDFEAMCRSLTPTSKRIFFDLGASLKYHGEGAPQPVVALLEQYEKFGFRFDHIYGFEKTFTEPEKAYDLIPEKYWPSYHWMNVGVNYTEGNKFNPLHSILETFHEDDFIVVKLDIDTPQIEVPLAKQLLEDKDGVYHKLVDQFYFEHHVQLEELMGRFGWKPHHTLGASVKSSLDLFYGLRKMGIPAHHWV